MAFAYDTWNTVGPILVIRPYTLRPLARTGTAMTAQASNSLSLSRPRGTAPPKLQGDNNAGDRRQSGRQHGRGSVLACHVRLGVLVAAGLALLTITLIGLFVVLPLVLVGSVALYLYVRHRLRRVQAAQRPRDGVIDAEYSVVDHRKE